MILEPEPQHFAPANRPPRALRAGEVHLWLIELSPAAPEECACLSADEWLRAQRFVFAADRERHIASRVRLRTLLGGYLDEEPARLEFFRGPHGKPALRGAAGFLRFNLSHADGWMLLGVTHAREIGVDLEAQRENVHFEMLAEHYFAPEDQWALRTTPEPERARKFFELWTATEARLKALGLGLNENPDAFAGIHLALRHLTPCAGHAAAVAVEGRSFDLACWQWRN
jgi:4'-phosphopantetheinyl transferase